MAWSGLKRLWQSYRCASGVQARGELQQWYRGPLGRSLAQGERQVIDTLLPNLFGYHLLQVGAPLGTELTAASRVGHHIVQVDSAVVSTGQCVAIPEQLPFAADSIDVVLLPHVLEYADEPHEVLRELGRVVIPEGQVVLLGFNPWSLWGLGRLLLGWRHRTPWCGRFFSPGRVKDWLSLLGFDTVQVRYVYYRPPFSHPRLIQQLQFLEPLGQRWWPILGGAYVLVAKKRVATLTPIRQRWRPQHTVVAPGLAGPTVRKQRHD